MTSPASPHDSDAEEACFPWNPGGGADDRPLNPGGGARLGFPAAGGGILSGETGTLNSAPPSDSLSTY